MEGQMSFGAFIRAETRMLILYVQFNLPSCTGTVRGIECRSHLLSYSFVSVFSAGIEYVDNGIIAQLRPHLVGPIVALKAQAVVL